MDFTDEQMKIINEYCDDNAKKLRQIAYPLIVNLGGVYQKDHDDFYSKASWILMQLVKKYDKSMGFPFDDFFKSCLRRRFPTYAYRDANRAKRKNVIKEIGENGEIEYKFVQDISLDVPLSEESDGTLADIIPDKKNVEDIVFTENDELFSDKMIRYLDRLSNIQKEILKLTVAGYIASEIISELHITEKEYIEGNAAIHSYRNASVLF